MANESSFIKGDSNLEENNKNKFLASSSQNHNNFGHVSLSSAASKTSTLPSALTRKRNNSLTRISNNADELLEIKELLRKISEDVAELKDSVQNLYEQIHQPGSLVESEASGLKPALKKVTFAETAHTIDELIKFKMECKNRIYDVIYNSRGQKTVVGPAYVDEDRIVKLSMREKARIYIPGKLEPLQVIGEVATAILKIGASTFTIESVLHRDRNTPVVLGREFGKKFIASVNTEHKILTLRDDNGVPCAITYELYLER